MSRISRCLLCEALLKDNALLQTHLTDHHNVLSVEGLYLLTHADSTPPPPDMAPAAIVRCPLCEALLKAHYIKDHFMVCHAVQGDQHNALSAKCYGLLMRAKSYAPFPQPLQKTNSSPLTPTTSPGVMPPGWPGINPELFSRIKTLSSPENSTAPHLDVAGLSSFLGKPGVPFYPMSSSFVPGLRPSIAMTTSSIMTTAQSSPPPPGGDQDEAMEVSRSPVAAAKSSPPSLNTSFSSQQSPEQSSSVPTTSQQVHSPPPQQVIKEEVLDDGGGSSDEGEHHVDPNDPNHEANFKKNWNNNSEPGHSGQAQGGPGYRVVPMYRSFLYNPAPPPPPPPRHEQVTEQQFLENTPPTSITFYEGQSFANFQQFKVLWDRYLSDTQTMVQKRSSKTGHDATYFPYKHVLYVCFYYGKGKLASWRDIEDSKNIHNRKCRFKLRLHFDTKVSRYRITKYNGAHSNHQLGKVQKRGDELLKAHSILRTHPLSSLTPLQHQSLGQDILFWQSGNMRALAEANPRLLSLSSLYPVAKEDFVLHLFYAHKDNEKVLIAWAFINCAVQRSAEIALTIFARFNPVTQKQAELVVMNHCIESVASAINIFCKAIFHLSLENVHEHLTKRLHATVDWERIESGAEKHKICLTLLERLVFSKNEEDYADNIKLLEKECPGNFMEYFYDNWNTRKDFWVYYIQLRTAEALKSLHLEKQDSKIENFLTINRKSLTSCISLLMLFGEAPDRLNAHLSLLETSQEVAQSKQLSVTMPHLVDTKPIITPHRSPHSPHDNSFEENEQSEHRINITHYTPSNQSGEPQSAEFDGASPSYEPTFGGEFFTKSVERPSPAGQQSEEPQQSEGDDKEGGRGEKGRLFSSESYDEVGQTTPPRTEVENTEYSPEYGITAEKVPFAWKNGDYEHSPEPDQEEGGTEEGNAQASSEDEASPAQEYPTTRSDYPPFSPALFQPSGVTPHFLPRHTFLQPHPAPFPPPYLHAPREFPPLARNMFPPPQSREIFSQPPVLIHSPVEREATSPYSRAQ